MKRSLLVVALAAAVPAAAQEPDYAKAEVRTVPVAGAVSMLQGVGGNIGVSNGPDGAMIVDDDYAPMTPKVVAALNALGAKSVRFVVNTHWHGDHAGGNENLAGQGALIVAHDNVRTRMGVEHFMAFFNEKVPASPAAALPVVTFSEDVTFHLNGDEIHVFHVPPAHTDGDAVVHFRKADVVHMGDTFFNGLYPFIDADTGGSIDGMIRAVDLVLPMLKPTTKVIPGHGPLGGKADVEAFRAMLVTTRDRITPMVKAGKTLSEIKAANPLGDLDAKWGGGFFKTADFTGLAAHLLGAK